MRLFLYSAKNEKSHKELGSLLRELPEGDYVIQIKKNRAVRSLNANKYYHAILNLICIQSGQGTGDKNFDHAELHEILKKKFNSRIIYFTKGGAEIVGQSTSDMDSKEFGSYVNQVKKWAQDEFGIIILEPQDIDYLKWMAIANEYSRTFSGY